MNKSIIYLVVGLILAFYGLFLESKIVMFLGVIMQIIGALMRFTDGVEKTKNYLKLKIKQNK